MKKVTDPQLWAEAWLDTALTTPRNCRTPEEAMAIPGCYVTSVERDPANPNRPRYFGRLVKYSADEDHVVVRSSDDLPLGLPEDARRTVWFGTRQEYATMWRCD